ncbi:hypothetical protein HYFRA_00012940 [Hymenoscyphus fraxineus]|uniref:Uncharacterized protein n=1 Tax=Hymenoscyphus fraxineus TaxID=746836 RepID=A0A9N9PXJ5_9HELO|nr:hypothetical protein HYFRA_00012940 [Hymenoscyphus fraxineus]
MSFCPLPTLLGYICPAPPGDILCSNWCPPIRPLNRRPPFPSELQQVISPNSYATNQRASKVGIISGKSPNCSSFWDGQTETPFQAEKSEPYNRSTTISFSSIRIRIHTFNHHLQSHKPPSKVQLLPSVKLQQLPPNHQPSSKWLALAPVMRSATAVATWKKDSSTLQDVQKMELAKSRSKLRQ